MKQFTLKARRSFRLPDGTTVERGQLFNSGVRSRTKDQIEYFVLNLPEQLEEIIVPCQHVIFFEGVVGEEVENGQGDQV